MNIINVMKGTARSATEYAGFFFKYRYFIIKGIGIVFFTAIIVSLLLPQKFTAIATILPPSPTQGMILGLSPGATPSLSSLGSLGGLLGLTSPSDLFAAIMKSRRVKGEIIKKFNLEREFKTKTIEDAYKALDEITKIDVSPEGIMTVSVTYTNKYLATDIANSYVEELDRFNTETAMTVGKKYRIFIEKRLNDTKDSLSLAEDELRDFQQKYRTVALDVEIETAIETVARLKSEIILREIQKGIFGSASSSANPYLQSIEQELSGLKNQLSKIELGAGEKSGFGVGYAIPFSKLPQISVEYVRLVRNAKVYEAIYELLTESYEQAKIMELKDTPTVQVLDRAQPPVKRSWPRRSRFVIISVIAALIVLTLISVTRETVYQIRNEPSDAQQWSHIVTGLRMDLSKTKNWFLHIVRK